MESYLFLQPKPRVAYERDLATLILPDHPHSGVCPGRRQHRYTQPPGCAGSAVAYQHQGLLVPRLSRAQRTASAFTSLLAETENGLLVFDTDDKLFYY